MVNGVGGCHGERGTRDVILIRVGNIVGERGWKMLIDPGPGDVFADPRTRLLL
jgi:hypothetical protein